MSPTPRLPPNTEDYPLGLGDSWTAPHTRKESGLHNHLERIAAQERATGVSRLGGPKLDGASLTATAAIITQCVAAIQATPHFEHTGIHLGSSPWIYLTDDAVPMLEATGAEWDEWGGHEANSEAKQVRSLMAEVGGITFVVVQVRPAPDASHKGGAQ